MKSSLRVAILFDNLGPYHIARLSSAARHLEILAIEFSGRSSEYAWEIPDHAGIHVVTVSPSGPSDRLPACEFKRRLRAHLCGAKADVIAIPGWSGRGAFVAMQWALEKRVPYIIMSDSTAWDEPRVAWKEAVKSKFIAGAASALVAGGPHADYLLSLGMPAAHIFTGYDVVDNDAFQAGAESWRRHSEQQPAFHHPYFMASCRFVPKKNLNFLLDAYAGHLPRTAEGSGSVPWDLVLMGDGDLKPELIRHAENLGLQILSTAPWECEPPSHAQGRLLLPGFRQIGELFRFYAGAGAFVHASITEQWGLVVNEAMASGLPIAVSNRCGCAADLVCEGRNGWTFPPDDCAALSNILSRYSSMDQDKLRSMGEEGRNLIRAWSPERFSEALDRAARTASSAPSRPPSIVTRLALRALILASR